MSDTRLLEGRAAGLLLHPSSLPGVHGIGSLGRAARGFVDFLAQGGLKLWQVLPLGPTSGDGSPYSSPSTHAGNPWLIDIAELAAEGWLDEAALRPLEALPQKRVDYPALAASKDPLLGRAAARFLETADATRREAFATFCGSEAHWLDAYARFAALKRANGGLPWTRWESQDPDPAEVDRLKVVQFFFRRQWLALRGYAAERGVSLVGDLPLFVAHDSADVWQHRGLFDLDEAGAPRTVAGCPPDYFTADGQLWGNPLYRWEAHAQEGFSWWIRRLRSALALVDVVRLDHFRGLAAFWEIPAGSRDARPGRWVEAPGDALLSALREDLGGLPLIAEDLGVITPDVVALRNRFDLPGMRVLQFAFGADDATNPFRPHNHSQRSVVYTGTHDNDTVVGWFRGRGGKGQAAGEVRAERRRALRYLGSSGHRIQWDFIRSALASVADTAIVPVQDVLGLGSSARMNTPGSTRGNWAWRLGPRQLRAKHARRLRELVHLYGR